jgi:hypothetical protein
MLLQGRASVRFEKIGTCSYASSMRGGGFDMVRGKAFRGVAALVAASVASQASAIIPFFFVFPIPHSSVDPDKIEASLEQRKLAMCAAYHQNVIDPEISGKKEDSYHGDVVKTVVDRLSTFSNSKKLIGAYIGQWRLQAKQNYQSGQDYARILIDGCNRSNLPVNKLQYDAWKNPSVTNAASQPSVRNIPARPIKLDGLISTNDFPSTVRPIKAEYAVGMTLQIDRSGKVVDCFIDATSGSDPLDDATCNLLKQRAQFTPAVEEGYLVVSEYKFTQRWVTSERSLVPANTSVAKLPPPTPARTLQPSAVAQPVAPKTQPVEVPVAQATSSDAIFDTAMNRCDRIGFKRGQADFKSCVMQQIRLLSEVK